MLKTGWLDTNGNLTECGEYQHLATARKIVHNNGYQSIINENGRVISDDEILLRHGWIQIDYARNMFFIGWRIYWNHRHHLSPAQKSYLEPYFEEDSIDPLCLEHWQEEMN